MSEGTPGGMTEHEPSMEDILASIRKVIAEDAPSAAALAISAEAVETPDVAIADLSFEDDTIADFDLTQDLTPAEPELGDIDDSSTQALLNSADFDLSDITLEGEQDALQDDMALALESEDEILDLTDMLADPEVALARDGSDVLSMPEVPVIAEAEDTNFDEMMDLVLDDGNLDADTALDISADEIPIDSDLDIVFDELDTLTNTDIAETDADIDAAFDIPDIPEMAEELTSAVSVDESAQSAEAVIGTTGEDLPDAVAELAEGEVPVKDEKMNSIAGKLAALAGLGAAAAGGAALAKDAGTQAISSEIDALDLMDIVEDDYSSELEQIIDPAEGLLSTNVADTTSGGDEDIDLVKSLMAELTDDNYEENSEGITLDTTDELDDIFEIALEDEDGELGGLEATNALSAPDVPASDTSIAADDVADDDLAAIITEANAEADAAAAQQASLEAESLPEAVIEAEHEQSAIDLENVEIEATSQIDDDDIMAGIAGTLTGVAAVTDTAAKREIETDLGELLAPESNDDSVIETEADSSGEETTPEAELQIEDESMPHIVKSEAVASEETVSAASDAFASLNKVVEEKTVESESGPRIGDLVQDALKPMLQEWLDKNLKGIVDRAVAKEIKRISSGK